MEKPKPIRPQKLSPSPALRLNQKVSLAATLPLRLNRIPSRIAKPRLLFTPRWQLLRNKMIRLHLTPSLPGPTRRTPNLHAEPRWPRPRKLTQAPPPVSKWMQIPVPWKLGQWREIRKAPTDLTPKLVERVHALYEELGRQDVLAVQELEQAEKTSKEEVP